MFVLVYVDDILITGSDNAVVSQLVAQLHKEFALKDLGDIDYFLGIQVQHTAKGLHLSQGRYITDLLQKAKIWNCKGCSTPMNSGLKMSAHGDESVENVSLYRSVVRALQYVTITRPEIAFSVNKACQFMQNPNIEHWTAVKRILRYLKGFFGVWYSLEKVKGF